MELTAYHPQNRLRSSKDHSNSLERYDLCLCIDFGKGWVKPFAISRVLIDRYVIYPHYASIKAAPFKTLYGRKCRSPVLFGTEVEERLKTHPELIQETTEKINRSSKGAKPLNDRSKELPDLKLNQWNSNSGIKFMLKSFVLWKRVRTDAFWQTGQLNPSMLDL
ncbi:hypothetical protein Tco_0838810 [Tanacetum coccineum]|uniref:Uncharacterized protein n=1 Tax=Tanacetum coccineum TaxID=301880 RepID=A0ABQ5ASX1_9ASTR